MSLTVIVVGSPIKGGIDGYNAAGVLGCTGETKGLFHISHCNENYQSHLRKLVDIVL
jgi:predicted RNA-binding protein with RPS1 domain